MNNPESGSWNAQEGASQGAGGDFAWMEPQIRGEKTRLEKKNLQSKGWIFRGTKKGAKKEEKGDVLTGQKGLGTTGVAR